MQPVIVFTKYEALAWGKDRTKGVVGCRLPRRGTDELSAKRTQIGQMARMAGARAI